MNTHRAIAIIIEQPQLGISCCRSDSRNPFCQLCCWLFAVVCCASLLAGPFPSGSVRAALRCRCSCRGCSDNGALATVRSPAIDDPFLSAVHWWERSTEQCMHRGVCAIVRQVCTGVQHLVHLGQRSTHAIAGQFGAFVGAQFAVAVGIVHGHSSSRLLSSSTGDLISSA